MNATQTKAIKTLNAMNEVYQNELKGVREQYNNLQMMQRLMVRHNMTHAEDAIHEEARQRCRRNQWAEITKNG